MVLANNLKERITKIVRAVTDQLLLELIDIELVSEHERNILRVTIDKDMNGVSLDDCAQVSRKTSLVLDVEDMFSFPYRLEVSSPGIFRELTTEAHFLKFRGKQIQVFTQGTKPKEKIVGILLESTPDEIQIQVGEEKKNFLKKDIIKITLFPDL